METESMLMWLFISVIGVFILMRLSSLAEQTRLNSLQEDLMRETVRRLIQKRKLDELYGRGDDENESR